MQPVAPQVWPGGQSALSGVWEQAPVGSTQALTVHAMPSSHEGGVPATQAPPAPQRSTPLHASPSSHAASLVHPVGPASGETIGPASGETIGPESCGGTTGPESRPTIGPPSRGRVGPPSWRSPPTRRPDAHAEITSAARIRLARAGEKEEKRIGPQR